MKIEEAIQKIEAALDDKVPYTFHCWQCGVERLPNGSMTGKKKSIVLDWEHEYGEFGTVLGSWPVFEVEPDCDGVETLPDDEPGVCPFSPDYGDMSSAHDEIVAMSRERHRIKREIAPILKQLRELE